MGWHQSMPHPRRNVEDDACLESVSTKSSGLHNMVSLGLPAMILQHSEIVGKLLAVDIANILTNATGMWVCSVLLAPS